MTGRVYDEEQASRMCSDGYEMADVTSITDVGRRYVVTQLPDRRPRFEPVSMTVFECMSPHEQEEYIRNAELYALRRG
jgi:hypothetical protein